MTTAVFLQVILHAFGATVSTQYIMALVEFLKTHTEKIKRHTLPAALLIGFLIGTIVQLAVFFMADYAVPTAPELAAALVAGLLVAFGAAGMYDLRGDHV